MNIVDLGLIGYAEAEAVQMQTLKSVTTEEQENTVYLLEHPRVITLGRQGGAENLHVDEQFLQSQSIDLVKTNRGGNITCHFPGQLVAYPIWRVEKRPGGMKKFFHDMEEAVIQTCAHFGVATRRRPGHPGVWVDEARKICSMGIGVKRWVTYHGLALNVGRDVSLFNMITLCGIQGATPTSLSAESGHDIAMKEAKHVFADEFRKAFADSALASSKTA
ncbi:lipoyl(octanoyl) transferase LipB [Pseudodesulfovibrio piezophilus]|uniref:Octanoyltransferase n=1 Tax=Pseudodesulfovibrio piezophilus (strain DSM 21447 / JCM 15486 / C1TLV30) TaxID=1322246 RepID=M1WUB2_PSEP2|nr:lipoyl(octanoyl) transferase LipB [Pseudodesulfovibrio piezophilus]CCH50482.1 Octanoyltransferase [Pseudodesulfovibrio piezophilus C1TLV30]